jgi:predicted SnoaL-like aldol condensation-catalyzing enzyme
MGSMRRPNVLGSPHYIQHSNHIEPGREGLFNLTKSLPPTLRYEAGVIVAGGDFVMVHGRFSGFGAPVNWIAADIVRVQDGLLIEHWDVIQDEVTQEQSKSGLPMFGDKFSAMTQVNRYQRKYCSQCSVSFPASIGTISAAIQFTGAPKSLNRPCTITKSPSVTIVPASYFNVGWMLLMRLNSPLRPGCDVSAVLHVVRRPESFCCGIVALLNSVSNASKTSCPGAETSTARYAVAMFLLLKIRRLK